ncbi:hypothetical protein [Phyllobacterium zundukense]|uniref:Uncharacterized protein n=1 Tax=Phyllobacterium zundukense TaxID=1867719 RepID=A0A2N9VQW2_9HYPH|nr:hypothetical protein [Phyllobacterium zundukense]ATU92316.1 hypothetical protein BLM14_12220 [Phyllobacterium zundukense]PIO41880.1 hypothetical protein B5P45_22665 [Phyllobacterium zundukense]
MFDRRIIRQAIAILAAALLPQILIYPASALTMKECSVKYKAAQDAGQAEGVSWSEFRKTQCAKPADAVATEASRKSEVKEKPQASEKKPEKTAKKAEPATTSASGKTTFPSSIAAKFAAEKPARARMHTCLEQYRANKDGGTLDGMRWIEKGGGYYKLCNARLKGDG